MRCRRKLTQKQKKIKKAFMILISVLLLVVVYFELTVKDRVELAIISQIKSKSHETINETVREYIKNNKVLFDSLVDISRDDKGAINSISENVYAVNAVKTDVIKLSQNSVNDVMCKSGIDVQLGNFTGLVILSSFGPYIHMDIDANTTIKCEIQSEFKTSGVNQTVHHTTLNMNVDIYVGNPIRIESIAYKTSFELSQTVIVGNIPNMYGSISRY